MNLSSTPPRYSLTRLLALFCALAAALGGSLVHASDSLLPAPEGFELLTFFQVTKGGNKALFRWEAVEGAAGYEIFIKGPSEWSSNHTGAWLPADHPDKQQHIFKNLKRGRDFYFRVRAVDAQGKHGEMTRRIELRVPPKAAKPQISVTSDSIHLAWEPVKNKNGKRTQVLYREAISVDNTSFTVDDYDVLEASIYRRKKANITGLKSDTDYQVLLRHFLPGYKYVSYAFALVRTLPAAADSS